MAEGFAALEVPNKPEVELSLAPKLLQGVVAVELLVLGTDILLRIEEVAHGKGEREAVAKAFLEGAIDHVCCTDDGIAHRDAVVVTPRKVDIELGRQREGGRGIGR